MKAIVLSFLMILFLNSQAQVMWQIKTDTVVKWYYQDGDEFNSDQLDENKWIYGMPWGKFVMTQDLYFADENVKLKDGVISFVANKEKKKFPIRAEEIDKNYLNKNHKTVENGEYEVDYTCGMITSKRKYKYGYFEIRFKSTDSKGIWPAFWLYGGEPNEEIDFFELKGERENQIHVDVHCPDGCENYRGGFLNLKKNWGGWIDAKQNLSTDWNIFSGEWQEHEVKWFLNGTPVAYFKGDFKTSQNLFLNTSVAKTGGGFSPGPDQTTPWPNAFIVDYFRVWSSQDTVHQNINPYREFSESSLTIQNNNLYDTELKKKYKYVYNNKKLSGEFGTVTLLPAGYLKYNLSFVGKEFDHVSVKVIDSQNNIRLDKVLENPEFYHLDLSELDKGAYTLEINIKGKILKQELQLFIPTR